jgi:hypothetical protein
MTRKLPISKLVRFPRDENKRAARRAAEALRKQGRQAPLVFVVPPLATALEAVQSVVSTEVAYMQQIQRLGAPMNFTDAKKLQALTSSLTATISAKRDLSDQELGAMTDEELEARLVSELEDIRAKRSKR